MKYQYDALPNRIHSKYLRSLIKSYISFTTKEPDTPMHRKAHLTIMMEMVAFFLTEENIKLFEVDDMKALKTTVAKELKVRQVKIKGFCKNNFTYLKDILNNIIDSLADESLEEERRGADYNEWVNKVSA